jgi:hypothetical protein
MAATNYTPIQLYYSTTASAAPVAGNLASGELAINITDGKLYYKDNGGVVQVIATKGAGTIGGSDTQIQYNNAGALAGNAAMTFNSGTSTVTLTTLNLTNALGATYGGTAQSSYTQGDILYSSATNTLAKLGIGTTNYILTSTGSVPQWTAPTSIVVQTATNLAGGAAGSVPYQSAADTTTFLAIGTANRVMTSSGTAPQWVTALSGLTGVSSSSITNSSLTSGRVVLSTTGGQQTDDADLTFDGTTLSAGGLSTTGFSTQVKTVTLGNSNFNGVAVFAPSTPAKLYVGTGTVTDVTSAAAATNTIGAISSLAITPIAATNANVTYTNAATLYIAGAPSASTNVTITNPYALYVAAGDAYFGGNVVYAGGLTLNGNVTVGDSSADTLTINSTITSNLIFTDNTYDIGASGATRPRNLYLAGAATLGTALTVPNGGTGLTSLTAGYIPYGAGTSAFASTSQLFYSSANVRLGVGGNSPATTISAIGATGTTFGFSINPSGWNNARHRLTVPTSGDTSVWSFNYDGSAVDFASYGTSSISVGSGAVLISTGTTNTAPTEKFKVGLSEAVFNEQGNDYDFRVESDTNTHALFVNAGANSVSIGTSTNFGNSSILSLQADGTNGAVGFARNTDNVFAVATDYYKSRGSASAPTAVQDGDGLYQLRSVPYQGSGYAYLNSMVIEVDGGYTSGQNPPTRILFLTNTANGSATQRLGIKSTELVVNDTSNDYDFRVESDTKTHMFFVDAGNNRIGINQSSPSTQLAVTLDTSAAASITSYSDSAGALASNQGEFRECSFNVTSGSNFVISSVATTSTGWRVVFRGTWSNNQEGTGLTFYAPYIELNAANPSTLIGSLTLTVSRDGSGYLIVNNGNAQRISFAGTVEVYENPQSLQPSQSMRLLGGIVTSPATGGHTVFNENGVDADFRVESDNSTHMLFIDAGSDFVAINRSSSLNNGQLHVLGATSRQAITTQVTTDANSLFQGFNAAGNVVFQVTGSGSLVANTAAIFNENGEDFDFRVESDTSTHALFVDASQSKVTINKDATTYDGAFSVYGATAAPFTNQTGSQSYRMYGKLVNTYTSGGSFTLGTLQSGGNLHYFIKVTARQVDAVSSGIVESVAYASVRWASGVFVNATVTQDFTAVYASGTTNMWSLSLVSSGGNYVMTVSNNATNYRGTTFDVEITTRDSGVVQWNSNTESNG